MLTTRALVQVAMALLQEPFEKHWGYDLSRRSGVRSGVLYPMLGRLLEEGWLIDGWEDPADTGGKRPPRRYYTLTDEGRASLGAILAAAQRDGRFAELPGWAGLQ